MVQGGIRNKIIILLMNIFLLFNFIDSYAYSIGYKYYPLSNGEISFDKINYQIKIIKSSIEIIVRGSYGLHQGPGFFIDIACTDSDIKINLKETELFFYNKNIVVKPITISKKEKLFIFTHYKDISNEILTMKKNEKCSFTLHFADHTSSEKFNPIINKDIPFVKNHKILIKIKDIQKLSTSENINFNLEFETRQ